MKGKKSLVCVSGGQDSTFCLFWAKQVFLEVEAVTFDYGQTHSLEKEAVRRVTELAEVPLTQLGIKALKEIAGGSLTAESESHWHSGLHPQFLNLPITFIPLRNLILFSLAAALAIKKGIEHLVVGISQTDYSGYPDCRADFLDKFDMVVQSSLGLDKPSITTWAPLLFLSKTNMIRHAIKLSGVWEAWAYTHTCYNNLYPPCGECDSCKLRAEGFRQAGLTDPLIRRAKEEGTK